MANPELLAERGGPDLFADEDSKPLNEGKSFKNLQRFLSEGAVAPVRIYEKGEGPDYSDRRIYYPGGKSVQMRNWESNLQITYDYAFGEKKYEQLAKEAGVYPSSINYIIRRTVQLLWRDSPQQTRQFFPFDSFDFKKPRKKQPIEISKDDLKPQVLPYPENLATGGGPDLFAEQDSQRKVFLYESWDNTISFLSELTFSVESSSRDPKDYIPPALGPKENRLDSYSRRLELAGKIFGGDYENPLSDIARNEKTTRECPRQVAERVLDKLYEAAPDQLKEKYPRALLSTNKQTSTGSRRR